MIVLVDAGNTAVKLAYLNEAKQVITMTLDQFYQCADEVEKVIYGNVSELAEFKDLLNYCNDAKIRLVEAKVTPEHSGIVCGYNEFKNLGVDRWLAILGARKTYAQETLIVVDAGTAVTIDVCHNNLHIGGWIAPGLNLMQNSIIDKAPGVFSSREIKPEQFGTDTPSALFHGCLYAILGMIQNAVELTVMDEQHSFDSHSVKLILTGGDANILHSHLSIDSTVNSELVFDGLKLFC